MPSHFEQRLARLSGAGHSHLLGESLIGLEKETLRVNSEGSIAQTPHPRELGAALTHAYITTDYSEALLELITPPFARVEEALGFLADTQRFVYAQLHDELLWATSMPCVVKGETSIPIARYGDSNAGMMKTVYRRGLGYRYGRVMQVIAGVHFNFSLSDAFWTVYQELEGDGGDHGAFVSANYFAMLRNLQRVGWLIPYLFGASPAVCKSFVGDNPTSLIEFDAHTYYEPYATSLRMGDIGYQNNKENEIGIKASYDGLSEYIESLRRAIETPCPAYQRFGVKVDGEFRQLNANILQIENEYYSTVRPKPVLHGNEKPTSALRERGVSYIELRSLDVNAFEPLGIDAAQTHFLNALMLYCLFQDSPNIDADEREAIDANELITAHRGREPGLKLRRGGGEQGLRDWAMEICADLRPICELLDANVQGTPHGDALARQVEAVQEPGNTPSARMLAEMRETGEGFYHFARRMSLAHQTFFNRHPPSAEQMEYFSGLARQSLRVQREWEEADERSFDEYLEWYFGQD